VSEAPTTAMLRGAKNSLSRSGVTSELRAVWVCGDGACGDGVGEDGVRTAAASAAGIGGQPVTRGSFGSPSPRSPMMLRWISLVPE
jgi:hypothetical protein